jgi:predicted nucleotidyltransferase
MIPYNISLWEKGIQDKLERNEVQRKEMLSKIESVLHQLSKRYTWQEIYVFGSVVRDRGYQQGSDVDFAVKGLPKGDLYRFVGELSDSLACSVDVVPLEETRLRERILEEGVPWEAGNGLQFS